MAHVIPELPRRTTSARKNHQYKFDLWLDGQVWELYQGEDYEDGKKFRWAAYSAAKTRGMRLYIRQTAPDSIVIKAVKKED